jgi:hypothetical protein
MPTTCRSYRPLKDGQMKPRNNMANGRKDAPTTQTHVLSFTKLLKYDRITITPSITWEDVTQQPKEETPWTSTQP